MPRSVSRGAALAALALAGLAAWLSLSDTLPKTIVRTVNGHQVLAHFALHTALSLTAMAALGRTRWPMVALLAGYAVALEAGQILTERRQVAPDDLAANLLGVAAGVLLARLLRLAGTGRG